MLPTTSLYNPSGLERIQEDVNASQTLFIFTYDDLLRVNVIYVAMKIVRMNQKQSGIPGESLAGRLVPNWESATSCHWFMLTSASHAVPHAAFKSCGIGKDFYRYNLRVFTVITTHPGGIFNSESVIYK